MAPLKFCRGLIKLGFEVKLCKSHYTSLMTDTFSTKLSFTKTSPKSGDAQAVQFWHFLESKFWHFWVLVFFTLFDVYPYCVFMCVFVFVLIYIWIYICIRICITILYQNLHLYLCLYLYLYNVFVSNCINMWVRSEQFKFDESQPQSSIWT